MSPRVSTLKQTCSSCPSQWEATLEDGRMVYIRYRYGALAARVSPEPTDDIGKAVMGRSLFAKILGEDLDGDMGVYSMMVTLSGVLDWSDAEIVER